MNAFPMHIAGYRVSPESVNIAVGLLLLPSDDTFVIISKKIMSITLLAGRLRNIDRLHMDVINVYNVYYKKNKIVCYLFCQRLLFLKNLTGTLYIEQDSSSSLNNFKCIQNS